MNSEEILGLAPNLDRIESITPTPTSNGRVYTFQYNGCTHEARTYNDQPIQFPWNLHETPRGIPIGVLDVKLNAEHHAQFWKRSVSNGNDRYEVGVWDPVGQTLLNAQFHSFRDAYHAMQGVAP